MAEDKDEQWLWRGKHLRQPTTLVGKILADLEFLTSQNDSDVTGGFDPNSNSWVRMNGMRVDRMFDLDEYHFKERLLRVHFLVSALFCATLYVASKYLWQEDHIGYLAVSGAAAICLYFLYERRYVLTTVCIGVALMWLAVPALHRAFVIFPLAMTTILIFYLLARTRSDK